MKINLQSIAVIFASVVGGALLTGAAGDNSPSFDTITVKRINVVEPDGTIRMVISDKSRFPGAFVKGKEHPHPRPFAGMLFFNDEGTENGGLIYNGGRDASGKVDSGVSLTFDRYQQDQQIQLLGVDSAGRHFAGLTVNDVADGLERPAFSDKDAAAHKAGKRAITKRMYVGKTSTGDSAIHLADAKGVPRLTLSVSPSGEAQIVFLDEKGNPGKVITAKDI